jgi:hypothetical protein
MHNATMYQTTLPSDDAHLMRVSEFRRYLAESEREGSSGSTQLSSLNPSLLMDLQRFSREAGREDAPLEALEVVAAAVRHGKPLLMHLQHEFVLLPLTVFPLERQVHCPVPVASLLEWRLSELRVLHVEPPHLPPSDPVRPGPEAAHYGPLDPLLWELALRGARDELLPEIAGNVAYRVAPGADLSRLDLGGTLGAAVQRLRRQTTNLREIAAWPGFDRERAMRMLNGLYLHAALMVSRSHPAATNDDWVGEPLPS